MVLKRFLITDQSLERRMQRLADPTASQHVSVSMCQTHVRAQLTIACHNMKSVEWRASQGKEISFVDPPKGKAN
jgi:hypothetical protein